MLGRISCKLLLLAWIQSLDAVGAESKVLAQTARGSKQCHRPLQDADECIRLAPDFAKGYSRKGHLQFFMKEYEKALETYDTGLKHDPANSELKEGRQRTMQAIAQVRPGPVGPWCVAS